MITDKNYFTEIERIGVSSLPDTLRKSHEFVVKSTNNGSSWDTYQNNDTIRKVINLYFEKLNQYLGNQPTYKTQATKSEPKVELVRKASSSAKPKSAKTKAKPKQKKATQKSGKKVEHVREELKFIKRFVAIHKKVKSPNSILSLLKGLQKAIIQKLIKKTSPLAKEIQAIQTNW